MSLTTFFWIMIAEIQPPPESFYYTLTVVFIGALIWIIKVYIARVDSTLKQLSETVADMKTMLAVHEEKHIEVDKKLEEKENPIVTEMNATLSRLNQTLTLLNADYDRPRKRRLT